MSNKLEAGGTMPEMDLPLVGGGTAHVGGPRDNWQMFVVYRGIHCPKCKDFLKKLESLKEGFREASTEILCASADTEDQATRDKAEQGVDLPFGYGLSMDQMRTLGVYISHPREGTKEEHIFPEPGLFLINPSGQLHIVDLSNAPFSRPDLDILLGGLKFIQGNDYPIRGTA